MNWAIAIFLGVSVVWSGAIVADGLDKLAFALERIAAALREINKDN